jgi:hypothetical protein
VNETTTDVYEETYEFPFADSDFDFHSVTTDSYPTYATATTSSSTEAYPYDYYGNSTTYNSTSDYQYTDYNNGSTDYPDSTPTDPIQALENAGVVIKKERIVDFLNQLREFSENRNISEAVQNVAVSRQQAADEWKNAAAKIILNYGKEISPVVVSIANASRNY